MKTVAISESCTGGLVSAECVNISGASNWFKSGIVTYNAEMKIKFLDVNPELAEKTNCVDPEIANQMAIGVTKLFNSEIGVGVTGYAEEWKDKDKIFKQIAYYSIYDKKTNKYYQDIITPDFPGQHRNSFRSFIAKTIFNKLYEFITPIVVFISGHRNITQEEFQEHYHKQLNNYILNNVSFVLGDSLGCDQMALDYLIDKKYEPNKITVYIADDSLRNWDLSKNKYSDYNIIFKRKAPEDPYNFRNYNDRDNHLTNISNKDLLWVRPSGTLNNLNRRKIFIS